MSIEEVIAENKEELVSRYEVERDRLLMGIEQHMFLLGDLTRGAKNTGLKELSWSNPLKNMSDGNHTFSELYHHRMILTKVIAKSYPDKCVKSWKHHDGTMFDNSFIVVFDTPKGQYSYHYNSRFWDDFDIKDVPCAPEYDGHKPSDIERLESLLES